MRATSGLDKRAVANLWAAAEFARHLNTPLNLWFVVAWETANTAGLVQDAQRHFAQNMRKWLERRGIPVRYLWVLERGSRHGIHANILVYVPPGDTSTLFRAKVRDWIRQCGGDILRGGTSKTVVFRPPYDDHGLQQYLTKGVQQDAAAWAKKKFDIDRVDQGTFMGRRSQVSNSIGPAVREAWYARQTDLAA